MSIEPLVTEVEVACTPVHAFHTWTTAISAWWPRGHSTSGDDDAEIVFEAGVGGRIVETTPAGVEHEWGEVLAWDPPDRLTYLWHIATDRAHATEVEVSFSAHREGTLVRIEHRGWERVGADATERRSANRAGWADVVPHFVTACARTAESTHLGR